MPHNPTGTMTATLAHEEHEQARMGFWFYILSDCLVFGALFATYAVLHNETAKGPGPEFFDLSFVLKETLILLASSFTASLAITSQKRAKMNATLLSLIATLGLGSWFLMLEISEFAKLIAEGSGPQVSAFLSGYFGLLGTHGLHVFFGSLWLLVMIVQVKLYGLDVRTSRRLSLFTLFWHFLDIVWIFIFTFVYLFAFL